MGLTSFANALWGRDLLQEAVDGSVSYGADGFKMTFEFWSVVREKASLSFVRWVGEESYGAVGVSYGAGWVIWDGLVKAADGWELMLCYWWVRVIGEC